MRRHRTLSETLGDTLAASGEHGRALPYYERALSISEKTLGPMHPKVASIIMGLARVYLSLAQAERAIPLLERAVRIRETWGAAPAQVADAHFLLARALWDAQLPGPRRLGSAPSPQTVSNRALALARIARDLYDDLGRPWAARRELIERWLADRPPD
jgi:tetratricopeptide (TPR) repeat protein